jgi:hypothetical protein
VKTRENDANSLFVLRLNSSARSLEKIPLEATMLEALDHASSSVTLYVTPGNDLESAAQGLRTDKLTTSAEQKLFTIFMQRY